MFVIYVIMACLIGVFVVFTYSHFWSDAEGYLYTRAHEMKAPPPEASPVAPDDGTAPHG